MTGYLMTIPPIAGFMKGFFLCRPRRSVFETILVYPQGKPAEKNTGDWHYYRHRYDAYRTSTKNKVE